MLMYLQDLKYLAGGTSDHNPLSVTLTFPSGGRWGGWKLSPGWLLEDQVVSHIQSSIETYWVTNADSAKPPVVWEAATKDHNQEGELLLAKEKESVKIHRLSIGG